MRNKKIQILLVFVLAIGLFGLLFYWRYGEKKQMESLNGLQETYKEYDKKIREIRNDMENKKAEVNDIEKAGERNSCIFRGRSGTDGSDRSGS